MVDSATVTQAVTIASSVATGVANATGHSNDATIIGTVTTTILAILAFVFGHWHGASSAKKAATTTK